MSSGAAATMNGDHSGSTGWQMAQQSHAGERAPPPGQASQRCWILGVTSLWFKLSNNLSGGCIYQNELIRTGLKHELSKMRHDRNTVRNSTFLVPDYTCLLLSMPHGHTHNNIIRLLSHACVRYDSVLVRRAQHAILV